MTMLEEELPSCEALLLAVDVALRERLALGAALEEALVEVGKLEARALGVLDERIDKDAEALVEMGTLEAKALEVLGVRRDNEAEALGDKLKVIVELLVRLVTTCDAMVPMVLAAEASELVDAPSEGPVLLVLLDRVPCAAETLDDNDCKFVEGMEAPELLAVEYVEVKRLEEPEDPIEAEDTRTDTDLEEAKEVEIKPVDDGAACKELVELTTTEVASRLPEDAGTDGEAELKLIKLAELSAGRLAELEPGLPRLRLLEPGRERLELELLALALEEIEMREEAGTQFPRPYTTVSASPPQISHGA